MAQINEHIASMERRIAGEEEWSRSRGMLVLGPPDWRELVEELAADAGVSPVELAVRGYVLELYRAGRERELAASAADARSKLDAKRARKRKRRIAKLRPDVERLRRTRDLSVRGIVAHLKETRPRLQATRPLVAEILRKVKAPPEK